MSQSLSWGHHRVHRSRYQRLKLLKHHCHLTLSALEVMKVTGGEEEPAKETHLKQQDAQHWIFKDRAEGLMWGSESSRSP
ncbi:hypothetical protein NQZ68_020317 [Dissostichus eleginoides]|nr:hypothetical protein NQZ68_020317 [Dissostichus eleginoides]